MYGGKAVHAHVEMRAVEWSADMINITYLVSGNDAVWAAAAAAAAAAGCFLLAGETDTSLIHITKYRNYHF